MRLLLLLLLIAGMMTAQQCVTQLQWTTSNGQIYLNGQPFVLKGVNYFGFETGTYTPHGLWSYDLNYFLDFIQSTGFNAIRLPLSMELIRNNPGNLNIKCDVNPGLCGLNALQLMDVVIDRYDNEYSEAQVIALWKQLVDRYKNKWNVFAIDLKNEPNGAATWGNSNSATDWNKAAERIINGLSDFSGLFFVEGIEWGNRLEGVAQFPINTGNAVLNSRVIYSPHCYGPDVYDRPEFNSPDFPNNLESIYNAKYGFIVNATGQPVVIGEWGGKAQTGTRDATWNAWYIEYLRRNCITNNFYWCLNPNSGDTGGLLEDDWHTPIQRKIDLVNRAQPNPTKFTLLNGQICIAHGTFPEARCQSGGSPATNGPTSRTTTVAGKPTSRVPTATTAAPTQPPPSTGRPVTSPPVVPSTTAKPSGGGGVTATLTTVNAWTENGQPMRQYTLKLVNSGSVNVCSVQLSMGVALRDKWNLEDASSGIYRTPSWMTLAANGGSNDSAGFISYGDATPTVVAVANC